MAHNYLNILLGGLLLVAACTTELYAQASSASFTAKNAVYLEIGGNAGYYSLNYDRIVYQKGNFRAAVRAGLGVIPTKFESKTYWGAMVPLELIGLVGRSKHFLETGLGFTPFLFPARDLGSFERIYTGYKLESTIPFRIGYRYQKPDGGFIFRVGYTPFLDFSEGRHNIYQLLFGGISIGKSF